MNIIFIDYIKKEIGGGHFVLARMANYFAQNKDANIIPHVFLNNYDGFYDRFLSDLPYKKEYAIPKKILALDRFSNAIDLLSASKEVIKFLLSFGLILRKYISDYKDCIFYICGSPLMVASMVSILHDLMIPDEQINIENFTGY